MENKRILIIKLMTKMAQMIGHKQDNEKLAMYANKLIKYDFEKIKYAFMKIVYESKFFPTLVEIENYINPRHDIETEALEMASSLMHLGGHDYEEFKNKYDEKHKLAVELYGGWGSIQSIQGYNEKSLLIKFCKVAINKTNVQNKKNEMKFYIESEKQKQLEKK